MTQNEREPNRKHNFPVSIVEENFFSGFTLLSFLVIGNNFFSEDCFKTDQWTKQFPWSSLDFLYLEYVEIKETLLLP